ncbi:MAG: TniB family NTP-binding protein [Candidatus Sulfotelmatobacter sp.]
MNSEFAHLQASSRAVAPLNDEERITWIRQERWIQYPRAQRILERLVDLVDYPPRDRMPCLVVYGATCMGKTHIIQKFLRDNHAHFDKRLGKTRAPVVFIQMPPTRESGQGSMAAKRIAPEEFRCACPLPRGVEQPALFILDHSVRVMIMAAIARFLLGRQSHTFFPSQARIPCEPLAMLPPSCYRLTDSELRFVQTRFGEWPKELQVRLSAFFPKR